MKHQIKNRIIPACTAICMMLALFACSDNSDPVNKGTEEDADIVAFSFSGIDGKAKIDKDDCTVTAKAKDNVDLTDLAVTFTLSKDATAKVNGVKQKSGVTKNDFSSPVVYSVTSGDGETEQDWTVTITGGKDDNGGGSVSGKRIKSWVQSTSRPEDYVRVEYKYNSDGSIKEVDQYNNAGHYTHSVYTNNSDGSPKKIDQTFIPVSMQNMKNVAVFTYSTNKTLQKMETNLYTDQNLTATGTTEYTFVSGRKTRELFTSTGNVKIERIFEYDSKGKRTITTESQSVAEIFLYSRVFTRTYNADGTLDTVTFPWGYMDNTTVTMKVTWENGKKAVDEDIYLSL